MNLNSGGFLSPPSRRGVAPNQIMERYLQNSARRGRSNTCCRTCLTSPRCAVSKVAFHFLGRRIVPSSKEGLKIHHYSTLILPARRSGKNKLPIKYFSEFRVT